MNHRQAQQTGWRKHLYGVGTFPGVCEPGGRGTYPSEGPAVGRIEQGEGTLLLQPLPEETGGTGME